MAFGSEQWMYNAGGGFYPHEIDNSVRFDSNSQLSKTPSSAGNRKTYTWSAWFKRSKLSDANYDGLFSAGTGGVNRDVLYFDASDYLHWNGYTSSGYDFQYTTTQQFRDPSAWYHIVLAVDTTDSGSGDRVKIYINGEQITAYSTSSAASQNYDGYVNNTNEHTIGSTPYDTTYFDGYITEVNFVDGTALTPASFGETKADTWIPKKYTGSYGTNGYYLDFATRATDPIDASGNGNNWGSVNVVSTDWMLDSPTNNFATLNPLSHDGTTTTAPAVSEGNLKSTHSVTGQWQSMHGTTPVSSGKWYYEVQVVARPTNNNQNYNIGFYDANKFNDGYYGLSGNLTYGPESNTGKIFVDTAKTTYGTLAASDGDIYMFALDLENDKFWVGLNGTWMASGNPSTGANPSASGFAVENGVARTWVTHQSDYSYGTPHGVFIHNCGQDSSFAGTKTAQGNTDANGIGDFYYSPPAGYLALCSANLPETAIDPAEDDVPADYFNPVLYTGNGSTQSITGVGFQPDLVWVKKRSAGGGNGLTDVVRGTDKLLFSESTNAEITFTGGIGSFDSDGFSLASSDGTFNSSGVTYVGWNWKAGGAAVANTDGTIASQVSANTKSGFSIATYNGSGAGTVGHGLSSTPQLVIQKVRNQSGDYWWTGTTVIDGSMDYFQLNDTNAKADSGYAVPTSSVFSNVTFTGATSNVAYCFHSVEGFSKIGTFTGSGSADGPFIYTGFRPAFVLVKNTSAAEWWTLIDNKRVGYNETNSILSPNESSAEYAASGGGFDLTSNGFKVRGTSANFNGSGNTILYIAFAEQPFKYANAR